MTNTSSIMYDFLLFPFFLSEVISHTMKSKERELAEFTARELGLDENDDDIIWIITTVMEKHPNENVTPELLGQVWIDQNECQCLETSVISIQRQCELAAICFGPLHIMPFCDIILKIFEFQIFSTNDEIPTMDDMSRLFSHHALMRSPEEYCNVHKLDIPTPDLDKLPVTTASQNESCALCQESIKMGSKAFKMPCCSQLFHFSKEECLGENTVLQWLSKSKKCMVCGKEVKIDTETNISRKRKQEDLREEEKET